jgi:hypothetical protein
MRKIYYVVVFSLFLSLFCNAQKNKRELQIGGKLINELTFEDGVAPGFGGQVVYKMGKYGGIESGIFYQTRYTSFYTTIQIGSSINSYFIKIAEYRLQLPILYRFDSRIINFSAGPVIDYFLGWKTKSSSPGVTVNSFDASAVRLTASAGVSKSINLSPSLILEPEIKFNHMITSEEGGLSLNISLRKKIF